MSSVEPFVMPEIHLCDFVEVRSSPDAREAQAGIVTFIGNETINACAFTEDGAAYALQNLWHRSDPSIRENPQRMEDSDGVWDYAQRTVDRGDLLRRLQALEGTILKRSKTQE